MCVVAQHRMLSRSGMLCLEMLCIRIERESSVKTFYSLHAQIYFESTIHIINYQYQQFLFYKRIFKNIALTQVRESFSRCCPDSAFNRMWNKVVLRQLTFLLYWLWSAYSMEDSVYYWVKSKYFCVFFILIKYHLIRGN